MSRPEKYKNSTHDIFADDVIFDMVRMMFYTECQKI